MQDYLNDAGIGASTLKNILLSPMDFYFAVRQKSEDTKSTTLGTAIHMMILEFHKFYDHYALCLEDLGNRSKEGRRRSDEFKKENEGKTCFFGDDAMTLKKVRVAVDGNHTLQKFLRKSRVEVTGFVEDKYHNIRLKTRPDVFCEDNSIMDIKTTSAMIDDESIARTIFKYGYHFQAAHQIKVFEQLISANINNYYWIFVSTETPAPHIIIKKASTELLLAGKIDHEFALRKHRECVYNNNWPGFPTEITEIGLPDYAKRNYE